ncbi:alpha/beta hydrolase [Prosthecobacter sp.]|uniref:alpha/beta hydrolase n=1 Tax=Prosthecobacter sp. TaxID=1965333 RepID=UPI002ABC7D06|nr:alpha/beta hydrolase [Prosthecobacter sp.]MDZ4402784.1 alpha/beta hydrolase [Prosthecobacter sp.]
MNLFRRSLRFFLRLVLALILLVLLLFGGGWWYFHPEFTETRGIVYTQRHGHALTLDVIRPANPNGIGILVMISGRWKSDPNKFQPWAASSFLRQGHTLVAVSHLSQPEANIMEIVDDVERAARFVRHHAHEYGIDPNRLGVFGGSSGGHLSLMLATRGGPGDPNASDPVDRENSAVQAVTVFYPVTDLLNLGPSTENLGDGGPPKSFRNSFGPKATDLNEWKVIGRDLSPIFHITKSLPPVLIAHGDADTLVPLEQSTRFKQRAAELGREVALTIRPGQKHGWSTMIWDAHLFAGWLTEKLR